MRIFVTGASGFIGSAVVPELLAAGHQAVGLARSDASAAAVADAGAEVHRGSLDDLDSLRTGAEGADGVIHLAFNHDFTDMEGAARTDLAAIEAMGEVLAGTGKAFVGTSGTLTLAMGGVAPGPDGLGTEDQFPGNGPGRIASEFAVVAMADRGVRSSVVRLAPSVHGVDDHGFVPRLITIARDTRVSAYVGDGASRWPAVHRTDAARLYRLAVESAPAGTRLHGVGDQGVPFREIAGAIGRHLDVPVVAVTPDEAYARLDFLGILAQLDNPTSSARTQELLGWRPEGPGLLADLDEGHYFTS